MVLKQVIKEKYGHYPHLECLFLNSQACYFRRIDKLEVALNRLNNAKNLILDDRFQTEQGSTYLNLCAIQTQLGDHQQALQSAQQAVFLNKQRMEDFPNETQENSKLLAISYYNLGNEQEITGDFKNAWISFKLSYKICKKYMCKNDVLRQNVKQKYDSYKQQNRQQKQKTIKINKDFIQNQHKQNKFDPYAQKYFKMNIKYKQDNSIQNSNSNKNITKDSHENQNQLSHQQLNSIIPRAKSPNQNQQSLQQLNSITSSAKSPKQINFLTFQQEQILKHKNRIQKSEQKVQQQNDDLILQVFNYHYVVGTLDVLINKRKQILLFSSSNIKLDHSFEINELINLCKTFNLDIFDLIINDITKILLDQIEYNTLTEKLNLVHNQMFKTDFFIENFQLILIPLKECKTQLAFKSVEEITIRDSNSSLEKIHRNSTDTKNTVNIKNSQSDIEEEINIQNE